VKIKQWARFYYYTFTLLGTYNLNNKQFRYSYFSFKKMVLKVICDSNISVSHNTELYFRAGSRFS
jgi:hypothetical protein